MFSSILCFENGRTLFEGFSVLFGQCLIQKHHIQFATTHFCPITNFHAFLLTEPILFAIQASQGRRLDCRQNCSRSAGLLLSHEGHFWFHWSHVPNWPVSVISVLWSASRLLGQPIQAPRPGQKDSAPCSVPGRWPTATPRNWQLYWDVCLTKAYIKLHKWPKVCRCVRR